jgi:2-C-methyl-D-erythritol 2,4-cyclodiphosphate synthase
MRIGFGYDSHAFTEGDHVYIGGIKIDYHQAVRAHSDGDVLLHAIADALLGAVALGDIGQHFPDTDVAFKNMESGKILEKIGEMLEKNKWSISNIDSTVITESPTLLPHREAIRKNIAKILNLTIDQISVKAKTNEKMGWIGKGEGLAACAVATVLKS